MSLDDFGAETAPPITTAEIDDDGTMRCPSCDAKLDRAEPDTLELPVSRLRAERIAAVFRDADIKRIRSYGIECPVCGAMFPRTVTGPRAHGWTGYLGTTVRRSDGDIVRVPARIEDHPPEILFVVLEVFSR